MNKGIKTIDTRELQLVAGGVIEGPDGKGCTEQMPFPTFPIDQGGPLKIEINVGNVDY